MIDRLRDGEKPDAAEYTAKYPHLREAIENHFQTLEFLEGERFHGGDSISGEMASLQNTDQLGEAISELSELMQRVTFLKNFESLPWPEIAKKLGKPEEELRRAYALVVRDLVQRFSSTLGGR